MSSKIGKYLALDPNIYICQDSRRLRYILLHNLILRSTSVSKPQMKIGRNVTSHNSLFRKGNSVQNTLLANHRLVNWSKNLLKWQLEMKLHMPGCPEYQGWNYKCNPADLLHNNKPKLYLSTTRPTYLFV